MHQIHKWDIFPHNFKDPSPASSLAAIKAFMKFQQTNQEEEEDDDDDERFKKKKDAAVSYMLMPTFVAVVNDCSTEASSWVDTCSSDG